MLKTLIIAAHRSPDESRINHYLLQQVRQSRPDITIHEIMREYPDYKIDVTNEQGLLLKHNTIVLLFPFYWYSVPAILKAWFDDVLEYGFAYGRDGDQLHGKNLQLAITTGSSEVDYQPQGTHQHHINDFLLPLNRLTLFTRMNYLPPFLVHGAFAISDNQLAEEANRFIQLLKKFD